MFHLNEMLNWWLPGCSINKILKKIEVCLCFVCSFVFNILGVGGGWGGGGAQLKVSVY